MSRYGRADSAGYQAANADRHPDHKEHSCPDWFQMDDCEDSAGHHKDCPRSHASFLESTPKQPSVHEFFDDRHKGSAQNGEQPEPDSQPAIA